MIARYAREVAGYARVKARYAEATTGYARVKASESQEIASHTCGIASYERAMRYGRSPCSA